MEVKWIKCDFANGDSNTGFRCGHGVVVSLPATDEVLGFIDGFAWKEQFSPVGDFSVTVYISKILLSWPESIFNEVQLAILLFLTDKKRQTDYLTTLNGLNFRVNG